MKAYKDLSKELRHMNLQELKFPELKQYQPGGKEISLVGKMKTRPKHTRTQSNPGASYDSTTHTEYTCESTHSQIRVSGVSGI